MYPIIEVTVDAPDLTEPVGTKFKFWYENNTKLFKEGRPGTGEDWAEKVACEICNLIGLPHATYDLATWENRRGVISENFLPTGYSLLHGNQLLVKVVDSEYPATKFHKVRQHTLKVVLRIVGVLDAPLGFEPFPGVESGLDVFLGYLLLDAWIGNNDRHHQNWALVFTPQQELHLAPTFDHASSLGRIESDDEKRSRLTTRDRGWTVTAYTERCRSAFYHSTTSQKPLSTFEAFRMAARSNPIAALSWLKRLQDISMAETDGIFRQIPITRINEVSIEFAQQMLCVNRERLMGLVSELIV